MADRNIVLPIGGNNISKAALIHVIKHENYLIPRILREQNTMRLAKLIPTWGSFAQTEFWFDMVKVLPSECVRKYRAWWNLLADLLRDPKDGATISCALAYLIKEKQRRSHSKEIRVMPEKWKIPPERAKEIEEYVRSRFEDLNAL